MDISFPFGRHESVFEALEEIGEGESLKLIIMNRDPVFPYITFQHGHNFGRLFIVRDLFVAYIIMTSSCEIVEDFCTEFTMVKDGALVTILFEYSETIFGGSGHFDVIICGEFGRNIRGGCMQ